MTDKQKLAQLKVMLESKSADDDAVLAVYLSQAKHEILAWHFGEAAFEDGDAVMEMPSRFDIIQINAVLVGYNIRGAEGESRHDENTINRVFAYEDMVHYIHAHVSQQVVIY